MGGSPGIAGYTGFKTIGRGGFSVVYSAEQLDLGRRVAIKVLNLDAGDESTRRRFLRECRAVGKLAGIRGIAAVHTSAFTDDGRPCIVMEHMDRGSLEQYVQSNGPLDARPAVDAARVLATALDAAHERGVIHRDIKPGNVLISATGDVALADFGISVIDDLRASTQTEESLSPPHAPPESFTGDQQIGPPVDIYSLGSTLFYSLTGRPPFGTAAEGGLRGLMERVLRDPLPSLGRNDVPSGFEDLLRAMMAKDPARRLPSMGEVLAVLESMTPPPAPAAAPTGTGIVIPPPVDLTGQASASTADWIADALNEQSQTDPAAPSGLVQPLVSPQPTPEEPVAYPAGSWPTSTDYAIAIQDDATLQHPQLTGVSLARDFMGMPMSAAGQSAIVFNLDGPDGPIALRCFTRPPEQGSTRYRALARHLSVRPCAPLVPATWLDEAVQVDDVAWPAVTMPWVPGLPLNLAVEDRLGDPDGLRALADRWLEVCDQLRDAGVAHGDLQNGNILVDEDLTIRLVDLDGVWVPDLSGHEAFETGHPCFQHPWRTTSVWNADLDNFAGALIYTSLRALAADPGLWRHHIGENLILSADDLARPGGTAAWLDLLRSDDADVRRQATVLEQCCASADVPTGTVLDLVNAEPLFSAPAPTLTAATHDIPVETASTFVPTTPDIDHTEDWWSDPAPPAAPAAATVGAGFGGANTPAHGNVVHGSNPPAKAFFTRPVLGTTVVCIIAMVSAGIVAAATNLASPTTPEATLMVLAVIGGGLMCTGLGAIADRASTPGQSAAFGVRMGACGAFAIGLLGALGANTIPYLAGLTVALFAVVGAVTGLLAGFPRSTRSVAAAGFLGACGGATTGVAMALATRAVDGSTLNSVGVAIGAALAGLIIGLGIGIGLVVSQREHLTVVRGRRPGRALRLDRPEVRIGTDSSCEIHIVDPTVMGVHAIIRPMPTTPPSYRFMP
ncbi:MAG: protein kinase domain-containing protein, partial [Microthrixaceae bacterium]